MKTTRTNRTCLIATILCGLVAAGLAFAAEPPIGLWEWNRTEESAGVFTLPGDVGYAVVREFRADLSYAEYRDGVLHREGVFRVEDVEFLGQLIPALYLRCGGDPEEVCSFGRFGSELRLLWGAAPSGFPSYPIESLIPVPSVEDETGSWGSVKSLFR